MPRQPRYNIANGLYHVTNRGVERRNIVIDDEDRTAWLRLFSRVALRYQWRVFAYALLDNHFHIYLRTPKPNLSTGMRDLEGGYGTVFNARHERVGHLFQGRFDAVLVENHSHSWELSRYVHLNPYRAGLTEHPFRCRWSSYRHYLNPSYAPSWLDWQTVLAEFSRTEAAARVAYKRFVEAGMKVVPRNPLEDVVDGWILGSDEFVQRVRSAAGTRSVRDATGMEQVLEAVAARFQTSVNDVIRRGRHQNRARDAAILLTRELVPEPLDVLANRFGGVSRTAICEADRRARARVEREPEFRRWVECLRDELTG